MSTGDKNRLRKTYSFFRSPPVFASGGGGGGGGASVDQFWHSTTNNSIYTTGSVIVRGGDTAYDSPLDKGADLFFYVSGSAGTRGTSTAGTALFGGDLVVSGSLSAQGDIVEITGSLIVTNGISGSLTKLDDGTSYLVAGSNIMIVSASNGSITISSTGGAGAADDFFDSTTVGSIFTTGSAAFAGSELSIDSPADKGSDVFFYVSGSRNSKDGGSPGVSLFGGDMVISGSFIGFGDTMEITGTLKVTNGISGSLTKLDDGTSYLVAGPGVLINSSSNGQVTVSSTKTLQILAGVAVSEAASGSMESIGMSYFDYAALPIGNKSYVFNAILAKTAGTTAYIDLYDYNGIINGTPGPVAGSVLTGSNESYTYLSADLTSQFSTVSSSGILEARIWCTPTGSNLAAICKSAKIDIL